MDDKEMTVENATELAILLALVSAQSHKGDTDAYKKTMMGTFNQLLNSFGFEVTKKA